MLQEKNKAMEELNQQRRELAHHQRLELMGTLTSGIAHEFNNLLAPIMGYSILVLEKLPPEETEVYDKVLKIYHTSQRAKTVISRLLELSGKNDNVEFREILLDETIRKTVELANLAKPKNAEVRLELQCQGQRILGNETQLSQLLLNLVINAFHAIEEKNGTLVIRTEVSIKQKEELITEAENKVVLLRVSDNGMGIAEEILPRIFEPFFSTKQSGKGTGLGLAIVQQIVEEHNAKIFVESKKGQGTTFSIEFPINNLKS